MNLFKSLATPSKFGHDRVHRGCPHEGPRIFVPSRQEVIDRSNQISDAEKRSMTDVFVGQLGKPAFNQIQPTTTCRNVVDDKTWMLRQLSFYGRMPMSSVVVHDQVQVLPPGKLVINTTQESEKFLMAMTFVAVIDHLPLQQIQGSK